MNEAIENFKINIERVRNLGSLSNVVNSLTTDALDTSDLLRAELVLAVSAFDHFIHEISRLGMLEIYRGTRPRTPAFSRFRISMAGVFQAIADPARGDWLEQEIRLRHGYQSFQQPDQIADAIRLISEVQLWNAVGNEVGMNPQIVRETLAMIINRRNQIAHEADMNPSFPSSRWPIDHRIVTDSVDFIDRVAQAIHDVVS